MPLSPKRVMHRKVQRGREKGNATRDNYIDFGEIALVAMEPTWLSARVIEAARAMGAKNSTIILKVLIPESLPAIISGLTVTAIALVGSTAMAGVIGAGGLGNLAYLDGFQRNNSTLTFVATVLILIIVFAVQILGDTIVKKVDKR